MSFRKLILHVVPFINVTQFALFETSTAKQMRSALFWVVTRRVVIISYRRFGTAYRSHLQGWRILFVKMVPICYPETSVRNCHYSLRNNPEKRSSLLLSWQNLFLAANVLGCSQPASSALNIEAVYCAEAYATTLSFSTAGEVWPNYVHW